MSVHPSWILLFGLGMLGVLAGPAYSIGGPISPTTTAANMTMCWQCSSEANGVPNPQCPVNASVDAAKAYCGPCFGKCYTRLLLSAQPTVVYRGCTADQWGLPHPLPPDGCYTWEKRSEVWCLCSSNGCNDAKPGEAGEVTFESYVKTQQQTSGNTGQGNDSVLPTSLVPGTPGVLQCWQCLSYFKGQHYSQCPLHGAVDATRAYIDNCTGRCFMHNSTNRTGLEVMSRGCTESQWGLPDPLPANGCYWWFSEVWCICAEDGCNGVALGIPRTSVEFDAHLYNGINHAATSTTTRRDLITFFFCLLLTTRSL